MCEMLWHLVSLDPVQAFKVQVDDKVVAQQKMRTLSIINLSIKDEVIPHIADFNDLVACWNKLKNLYEFNSIVRS